MAISNPDISRVLASYLERYPEEVALLSEPLRLLSQDGISPRGEASRCT